MPQSPMAPLKLAQVVIKANLTMMLSN